MSCRPPDSATVRVRGDRPRRVRIAQDEDGVFVAEVPSLPGCVTQGSTRQEALANVHEAVELYLESLAAHQDPEAILGTLRGTVTAYDEPTEPVGEDDWETLR